MNFDPRFDTVIDRLGTHCMKWDMMETLYGVPSKDGISMWVADMDFRPPQVVTDALQAVVDHGIYGYFGDKSAYHAAIAWWMEQRHGWKIEEDWIFTTHGLVNGTAMCLDAFTEKGDGIVMFTPIYHAFARVINASEREVVSCEMVNTDGHYTLDFDAYDAKMTGNEKLLIFCSPHNPSGRVWTKAELEGVIAFCKRHDLILVSDEIHHDLLMPGQKHIPMALMEDVSDRLVMMTASTKTFNIAGTHVGNVIIENPEMRARFGQRMAALGLSPNSFGLFTATAAYSPEGAAWTDDLCAYLKGNADVFDAAVNKIPGLKSMKLESTYLAWVDFSGTGMAREEFTTRVEQTAKIAANHGPTFGKGGDDWLRFNIATPRSLVVEATERLAKAFSDLQ
ncbi:MAG: MalY/PatB family protein [Pseudomonadota bacterium]